MTAQPSVSSSSRRLRLVALVVVLVVVVVLVRQFWPGRANAAAAPKEAAVPVSMQQVQHKDLPIWLDAIGNVQALNTVNVRVQVDGELKKVLFTEGQMVNAGSQLAQVDPRVYQAQLAQAQALVAKDQAQLANLKVNLERATKLAAAKAVPVQDVDTFRAQLAASRPASRWIRLRWITRACNWAL